MLVQFRICGFDLLFLDLEIAGSETEPSDLVAALATAAKLELTATPRYLVISSISSLACQSCRARFNCPISSSLVVAASLEALCRL